MNFFRYLTINTTIVAALACAVFCGMQTENVVMAERPLPAGSPELVMQKCEAPAEGLFPTGVVIQKVGGGTFMVRNQSVVDLRLEQALNEMLPKSIRVLSFCK